MKQGCVNCSARPLRESVDVSLFLHERQDKDYAEKVDPGTIGNRSLLGLRVGVRRVANELTISVTLEPKFGNRRFV